jgi:hypothetical protein
MHTQQSTRKENPKCSQIEINFRFQEILLGGLFRKAETVKVRSADMVKLEQEEDVQANIVVA